MLFQSSEPEPLPLDGAHRRIQFIWWTFAAVVFLYGGVAAVLNFGFLLEEGMYVGGFLGEPGELWWFPLALGAVGVFHVLIVALVPLQYASGKGFFDDDYALEHCGQIWLQGNLVRGALLESIAIYGLAVSLVTGGFIYTLLFAGVTLVAMFFFWPRQSDLEAFVKTTRERTGQELTEEMKQVLKEW